MTAPATAEWLFGLLPTIYRLRDGEGAGTRDAFRGLLEIIGDQLDVLDDELAQLYEDQFVETCAPWVAPYIGDLIGYRTLHSLAGMPTARAEVGHTIAFRRRKGTASMLEQLANDVTDWPARVVEYFRLLATTQYLNHLRPGNLAWVPMGSAAELARIGTPFETAAHTAEVRRIATRRGRYGIPNVGVHLWRIRNHPLEGSPAVKLVAGDVNDRRYLFSPLGVNSRLYSVARGDQAITRPATREDVPWPITRRELWDSRDAFYGASISIQVGNVPIPPVAVSASDLSDTATGWAYHSDSLVLIDPELGRFSLPRAITVGGAMVPLADPVVTFNYGSALTIGGGSYPRTSSVTVGPAPVLLTPPPAPPADTLANAVTGLAGPARFEVRANARFLETLSIVVPDRAEVELRAGTRYRPTVVLSGDLVVTLGQESRLILDGFLFTGGAVKVMESAGGTLRIRHCTLVPGISLALDGSPVQPALPSLVIGAPLTRVVVDHSIVGGIRADQDASVEICSSVVDAIEPTGIAYAALDGAAAGGELSLRETTVIGRVHARILRLVSNSILDARVADADLPVWPEPVIAERRQEGCIRFSYVPLASRTPRRHRCVPASDADVLRMQPVFTSRSYGDPAYAQLDDRCPVEIGTGADDESEMGATHDLFQPQRETNLDVRLDEYLRFGLEAGVFHAS